MQRIGATCQPCASSLFPRAPIRPGVIELAQPPILSLAARAGHVFASWDEILIGSWNSPSCQRSVQRGTASTVSKSAAGSPRYTGVLVQNIDEQLSNMQYVGKRFASRQTASTTGKSSV